MPKHNTVVYVSRERNNMQVVLISQLIKNQVEKDLSHFLDKNVASSLLALEQDYSCASVQSCNKATILTFRQPGFSFISKIYAKLS